MDLQTDEFIQPVTTAQLAENLRQDDLPAEFDLSDRAIRELVGDLETMGLVETWIESRGRDGRVKQIEVTFDPQWARDVIKRYLEATAHVDVATILDDEDADT